VLTVEGEIDAVSAPQLRDALEELNPRARVMLDLSALTFIDSSGLKVLVVQSQRMREAGGALLVRCPSPPVQQALTLTGIDGLIERRSR
jgi:anti-sigma B factor antagonist